MDRFLVLPFVLLGAGLAVAAGPPEVRTHPLVRDHWTAVVVGTDPDRPPDAAGVLYLVSAGEDVFAACRLDVAGNPTLLRVYDFRVDYEHASPRPGALGFDDDPRTVYVFNHRSTDDPAVMPVVHVYRWDAGSPRFERIAAAAAVRVPRRTDRCATLDGKSFWLDAEGRLLSAPAGTHACGS